VRDFKPDALDARQMSDLLWAAFGVNRPENAHRTAPSAKNSQEIDLYVATADGVFVYEAGPHRLRKVAGEDVRLLTSGQDFAKVAPVALIYVADFTRFKDTPEDEARIYAAFDTGCICQNVYLYCASAGLGTVVHDLDRAPLAAKLGWRPGQHVIMAQAVGLPK
jgi:nitroreductase